MFLFLVASVLQMNAERKDETGRARRDRKELVRPIHAWVYVYGPVAQKTSN